jgi:hypothetical protein
MKIPALETAALLCFAASIICMVYRKDAPAALFFFAGLTLEFFSFDLRGRK